MDPTTRAEEGPTPAALAGSGLAAALRRGLLATRPKFFTASVLPVLVGTAWAGAHDHAFQGLAFALALLATVLAHAATNVYNDVGDDLNGTDPANTGRIYPYTGGSRFIQAGILTRAEMLRLAIGLAVAALLVGLALVALRGSGVLLLGGLGLALGLLYSHPGVQLSGRGIGELACAIGLGLLPVVGAAWLQAGRVDGAAWLLGLIVAVWVCLILVVNEVPDAIADRAAGKHTLVVRLGTPGARAIYRLLTLLALAAGLVLVVLHALPRWALVPVFATAAAGLRAASLIHLGPGRRDGLRQAIEMTLGIHAIGCLALIVAAILG